LAIDGPARKQETGDWIELRAGRFSDDALMPMRNSFLSPVSGQDGCWRADGDGLGVPVGILLIMQFVLCHRNSIRIMSP
jgi:hypothetical protein